MTEQNTVAIIEDDAVQSTEVEKTLNRLSQSMGNNLDFTPDMVSTVDLSDEDGQDMALVAMTGADRLQDNIGTEFNLVHFVAERSEALNQETGEMLETVRLVLIKDDGTAFSTNSPGIARSLAALVAMRGAPANWNGASRVVVEEVKTLSNRRAFALRYLGRVKAAK